MPVSVTMPRLGESVTEGTITRWLKQEGDRVEADEPLLEVSTDKVDTEIPSPASGILTKILVPQDESAEVGAELAQISSADEPAAGNTGSNAAPVAASPAEPAPAAEATEPAPVEQPAAQAPAPPPVAPAASGGAATAVAMPALGESVTEGTVTRWLKAVGDTIEADEPLLEVSTDKVDTEIPSPVSGTVQEILVPEDETAAVGAPLAMISTSGAAPAEAAPQASSPPPAPAAPSAPAAPAAEPAPAPAAPAPAESPNGSDGYVTPLVRKLAKQHGVDLASLTGTGVGGRVRKQDVLEAAANAKAAPGPAGTAAAGPAGTAAAGPAGGPPARQAAQPSPLRGRTEKLPRLRMTIAKRMVESLQVSAQLTTVVEVDVTKVAKLRAQAKDDFLDKHGVKLSYLPFFVLATVEALRVHPNLNASMDIEAGTVTYHDSEHLGMAVDTEKGLIVPVIRNAGDLNLAGLARRIADVAERTRTGQITPDELSGGTFTLTNTGSRGALFDTPIINQPQVGILGTGSVVKRAVVVDDPDLGELILPRYMVYLALSYDHRLVDGADAARFLSALKERLEGGNFESEIGL